MNKVTLATIEGTVKRQIPCDLLVASAGLTPQNGPLILAQASLAYDDHTGYFLSAHLPPAMAAAGRLTGRNHPLAIEASGRLAGLQAAACCGAVSPSTVSAAQATLDGLPAPQQGCKLVTAPVHGRKCFICFDTDTTTKHVKQAIDMGFDVPELIKRFTSAGTGPGRGGFPATIYRSWWPTTRPRPARPGPRRSGHRWCPSILPPMPGRTTTWASAPPCTTSSWRPGAFFSAWAPGVGCAIFLRTPTAGMRFSTCAPTWACWMPPPWESSGFTDRMPSARYSGSISPMWAGSAGGASSTRPCAMMTAVSSTTG